VLSKRELRHQVPQFGFVVLVLPVGEVVVLGCG
jgi:hypothetical protein